jgi:uncharacterized phiE125 gp8 family phage protein
MYTLVVTTPPASEPVTVQELMDHLRLNDNSETDQLQGFITSARLMVEAKTGLALLPTTFRQYVPTLTATTYLMRSPVISVAGVSYYDGNDNLQTTTTGYTADIIGVPGSINFTSLPTTTSTTRTPKAYVTFTAGYADAATVPYPIKLAVKELAAFWYENREAYTTEDYTALPFGFDAVCSLYRTGLMGPWGAN